jgi:hypothetical protein
MALFTEASFSGDYDRPVGVEGAPAYANDPVVLQLSDGTSVTVFDKLTTALRLGRYMREQRQWMVAISEDITMISANGGIKMMLLENTLLNQKLLHSFSFTYTGDELLFAHRQMSSVTTFTDALRSVGFCVRGLPFANNLDLRLASTGAQLIDWNYQASLADSSQGSLFSDASPLLYDFTA